MCAKSTLWILFCVCIQGVFLQDYSYDYEDEIYDQQPLNCSTTESIINGHVSYSKEGLEGSVLTYHCGPAKYPFPVSHRVCGADGEWSRMTSSNGRLVSRATCKDVLCPAQLQLDNGNFWPRNQWFRVNRTQSFSCQQGFTLHGSAHRNCTLSGDWTGDTPICENHGDDCDDPGIPPGAERSAGQFHRGQKVTYRCQAGLNLLGSAERVCLENREWSGSTPRCQGPNTFDSPSFVAAALAGSLAGVMDVLSPDSKKTRDNFSYGRAIRVDEVSRMNVFILLDTSGSIKKKDFEVSRNATVALIRKLDSYDVELNFHVVSFASEVKIIVDILHKEFIAGADGVIDSLMTFSYNSHGKKTGTNLYSALRNVNERIGLLKQNSAKNHFNETQNIIIIETDGFSNTGGSPRSALASIRESLGYNNSNQDHTNERMLDVYVFGVGDEVKKEELNALASKKNSEQHLFFLDSYQTLGDVFNSIISDQSVAMCGIAQEDVSKNLQESVEVYTKPWHVTLSSAEWGLNKYCSGSIISQNWVLTAAHCFTNRRVPKQLVVAHGGGETSVRNVTLHPKYNLGALSQRNMSEFYDYDVALVQTSSSISLSWKARPICLPCTIPASRAMKRINSTCEDHRKELLGHEKTSAFFTHKKEERKKTHIHTQTQRAACVEKARQILTAQPTDVTLDEFVPDRFLCTGGTKDHIDGVTCKGDSGGALFLEKRKRYFQVGVVSWGTIDTCNLTPSRSSKPPPDARDFHINLFKIMPWLKEQLGAEIQFLPEH